MEHRISTCIARKTGTNTCFSTAGGATRVKIICSKISEQPFSHIAVFTYRKNRGKLKCAWQTEEKQGKGGGCVVRAEFSRSLQHGNSVRRLVRLERGFTGEKFAGEENPYQDPERN
jgi:hypothetical protein